MLITVGSFIWSLARDVKLGRQETDEQAASC